MQGMYMKNGFKLETFEFLLDKEEAELELEGLDLSDPSCWVKINPGLFGFYRVAYDAHLLRNLFGNLSSPYLTSVDRMGLFDDQVAMVLCQESGKTVRILELAKRLSKYETSIAVWRSVAGVLHQIRTLTWFDEGLADHYDRFCLDVFKPLLTKIGYSAVHVLSPIAAPAPSDDSADASLCRGLLYYYCAVYGDQEVRDHARVVFQNHVNGSALIPCQMRDAIYRAVMVDASQATFEQLRGLYKATEAAEERNRILMAFGYCESRDILAQVLYYQYVLITFSLQKILSNLFPT